MLSEKDKLNRVEELKRRLYSKNYRPEVDRVGHFSNFTHKEVTDHWRKKEDTGLLIPEKINLKASAFKKFFIFSIIFFILSALYASYMFFLKGNTVSNDQIEISVLGNTFTAGGEELSLQIEVVNKNALDLELADLVVEYPKGSSGENADDKERVRHSLGSISSGGMKNENVKIILFGEQGSTQPIKIYLEYRLEGSNAIFVKEKDYAVSINSAPVNIVVESPSEISSNQEMSLNVKINLNASRPASKMLVRVDYPLGFQFTKATPAPSFSDNVWNLGDLPPGSERSISISGKMLDVSDGEEKVFRVTSGSQSITDKTVIGVVFNSYAHAVVVSKPFLEAKLYINGLYQKDYAVNAKKTVSAQIEWANNLDTKINNLKITAKITGNALDKKSIMPDEGFYNSSINTITWDKNSKQEFAEVQKGQGGTVQFKFSPSSFYSGTGGNLAEPVINIDVSVSAKEPLEGNVSKDLNNSESKIIRIISDTGFAAKALYYSGPFSNSGPVPPKVEQKTTFTIVWTVSNSSNGISNAEVRSTLPPWVNFTGKISPSSETLTVNPDTKEIIWKIGAIKKTSGQTGSVTREVAFQVEFIPSVSQIGTPPILINDAVLTAVDDFANVNVRVNKASLDTRLANDPLFPVSGGRVVE